MFVINYHENLNKSTTISILSTKLITSQQASLVDSEKLMTSQQQKKHIDRIILRKFAIKFN